MPALSPVLRVVSDLPSAVPGVWHADSLSAGPLQAQPTGHALLDAQLPGGGWPVGAMTEVLQARPGLHEWQLVLPALVQAAALRRGAVVVVWPPRTSRLCRLCKPRACGQNVCAAYRQASPRRRCGPLNRRCAAGM